MKAISIHDLFYDKLDVLFIGGMLVTWSTLIVFGILKNDGRILSDSIFLLLMTIGFPFLRRWFNSSEQKTESENGST